MNLQNQPIPPAPAAPAQPPVETGVVDAQANMAFVAEAINANPALASDPDVANYLASNNIQAPAAPAAPAATTAPPAAETEMAPPPVAPPPPPPPAAPAAAAGVTIQCPGCSTQLKITDTQRPLTVACPGCQTHLKLEQ